jgi:hypothetical protein
VTGILDPAGPWVWLLYTLAGAGFIAAVLPWMVKMNPPIVRDIYAANPGFRALVAIVLWAIWPVLVGSLLIGLIWGGTMWVWDLAAYGIRWSAWWLRQRRAKAE